MIRFLLSVIILALLITYAIVPAIKFLLKFGKKELKRVDKAFNKNKNKK